MSVVRRHRAKRCLLRQVATSGDWCWFGGRMIQQLIRYELVETAYHELQPMVARVNTHGDFYEWWSLDNQPRGSR